MNMRQHLIDSIKKLRNDEFKTCLDRVNRATGNSDPAIIWDMLLCAFKHRVGYSDYTIFGMYDMDDEQRKTLLTRFKNQQYIDALNKPEDRHFFENKIEFLNVFSKESGREFLDLTNATYDDFEAFFQKHGTEKQKILVCSSLFESVTFKDTSVKQFVTA